ncbi:MAG: CDP-alcohol phosphatidyltransferase family protein [Bacteroidetes bacterium]|nr:CDP-alcohol phosphatidyltransferase family protein [Bacteroidota bacterium]
MDDILSVEKRWTVSNILSLSRIVLLIPIVVLILHPGSEYRIAVLALMLLAAATDFFDGLLARVLHQVTDFGRLLDPAADKVCIITGALALVIAGDVPLWYAILVGMRDIIILIGSLRIMNRRKVVVQSVWTGKWTVSFIAAYLILATLKIDSLAAVKEFFLYLSTIAVFVSLIVYTRIYKERMAKNGIA